MDILIVDDNPSITRSTALVLRHKGYPVSIARDGLEAIEKVRDTAFNPILMDIRMPHMNGVETFRRIKQIRPGVAVMLMTAYAMDDLIQQALDEGVHGVLYKPLDIDALLSFLEKIRGGTQ